MPRGVIDIDGAYDLHVHSSPDLFPRVADDVQMVTAAAIAHCIKRLGPSRFVISSDGGQAHNPMPADGYRQFVHALHAAGIAAGDFRVMCRDNGDFLVNGWRRCARARAGGTLAADGHADRDVVVSGRILTTHAGSLPRPDDLIELNRARQAGEAVDEGAYQRRLAAAVADVVRRQRETGIDLPGDGEYGKAMGQRVNYGAWWSYSFQRLGGLALGTELYRLPPRRSAPGEVRLTSFSDRRDRGRFAAAYADPQSGVSTNPGGGPGMRIPVCVGPLTYAGQAAIRADIEHFKAALEAAGVRDGFMTSIAPGSASRIGNEHYATEEELVYACADALREEYKAILDAGLILQLDDPALAENWDMINPAPTPEAYRKFSMIRVEALNHALRGLPPERIRFHLCWGSWHGPHVTDIPLRDIVDVMLAVNCRAYSFEAANVRHEHEWRVWREVKLPDGKVLVPGVVSHATNVVEHPELVADRILRFAQLVGPDRVVAGTDCGLGGRVHAEIAWAKLEALVEGAALAGTRL
jgi:5-methyltetrahydropteroyltriglutamate--homocysteine methyltransferase